VRFTACSLALGLALTVVPGVAVAGEGCGGFDVVTHIFDVSDSDGSGSLSRQEYEDAGLERYGVKFDDYDANGDGEASFDEYIDMYNRHHLGEGELET